MIERIAAIVGRPNVGKSALFNRLAGRKIAIVHDMPGVTRDRITAECRLGRDPFTIIDTGGIGADVDTDFTRQVAAEVRIALETAHVIVFVVDAKDGITPVDAELARMLRRSSKPIVLVANKIDHGGHEARGAEFSRLGFSDPLPVSAEHGRGISDLVAAVESRLPPAEPTDAEGREERPVKIAIVGRPNVGKSSLTNAILHDDRTLVSAISGTTRDAVDIPYERKSRPYVLIDTAGIRARSKVSASVEVFSVMRAETSVKRADLCLFVVDASMGITAQDKKIAGLIQKERKPCVVAVNKWDLVEAEAGSGAKLKEYLEELQSNLFAIDYAPVVLCSAKEKFEMARLFNTIEKVRKGAETRIGTGVLNRVLQSATTQQPPPAVHGRRFKALYATQPQTESRRLIAPVEVVIFCNSGKLMLDSYRRYLEGRIREECPYPGLPLLMHFREREPRKERGKKRR
ncbi:MAG: ribosome biogenesis GTPase Der [Chthoniobacteraceae bacterium]